ncbi:MAG: hypothetical protein FWG63_02110 [Defluviitaleaceae bacterium]|nr:hypothetical protein [Defluviitaleaceae bacterium]
MLYIDINDSRTIHFTYKNYKITIITETKKIRKANLIINPPALVRFATYPDLKETHLHKLIQNSIQDYFSVNLYEYTTDYRILGNGTTMLVAVKTDAIEEYINRAGVSVQRVDLYQNFASTYIGNYDKGNIVLATIKGGEVVLQFMEKGLPTSVIDCDYTNLERIFSPYVSLDGISTIERAYLPKTTLPALIDYLQTMGLECVMFDEIYDLQF